MQRWVWVAFMVVGCGKKGGDEQEGRCYRYGGAVASVTVGVSDESKRMAALEDEKNKCMKKEVSAQRVDCVLGIPDGDPKLLAKIRECVGLPPEAAPAAAATTPTAPTAPPAAQGDGVTHVKIVGSSVTKADEDKMPIEALRWYTLLRLHFDACMTLTPTPRTKATVTATYGSGKAEVDVSQVPAGKLRDCVHKALTIDAPAWKPVPPPGFGHDSLTLELEIGEGIVAPPPPPGSRRVTFMSARTEEGARDRRAVTEWLEASWAPKVKPCFGQLPIGSNWKVELTIAADGTLARGAVTGQKDTATPVGPAEESVATCITTAGKDVKMPSAQAPVKTLASFYIAPP